MIYLSFLCMNSLLYSSCILKKNSWWERVSSLETFSQSFYQLSFQSDEDSNLLYWVKKYNLLWLKMYGSEITLLCLQAIDKQIHVIILEHINYVLLVIDNIIVLLKSTFRCLNSLFFFFYSTILTLRQTIRMIGCILVPLYMKKKKDLNSTN